MKMSWPSSFCDSYPSESLLNSDNSSIYSIFIYGYNYYYVYFYFVCFSSLDGNIISSRYKSSTGYYFLSVNSIVLYEDYVISIIDYNYLVIYNITTFAFTIKLFNGGTLYSMLLDSGSGR